MANTEWTMGNKTVKSLTIGNKEIKEIKRFSDNKILYQKQATPIVKIDTQIVLLGSGWMRTGYLQDINGNGLSGKTVICYTYDLDEPYKTIVTKSNGQISSDFENYESVVFEGDDQYNGCVYP